MEPYGASLRYSAMKSLYIDSALILGPKLCISVQRLSLSGPPGAPGLSGAYGQSRPARSGMETEVELPMQAPWRQGFESYAKSKRTFRASYARCSDKLGRPQLGNLIGQSSSILRFSSARQPCARSCYGMRMSVTVRSAVSGDLTYFIHRGSNGRYSALVSRITH